MAIAPSRRRHAGVRCVGDSETLQRLRRKEESRGIRVVRERNITVGRKGRSKTGTGWRENLQAEERVNGKEEEGAGRVSRKKAGGWRSEKEKRGKEEGGRRGTPAGEKSASEERHGTEEKEQDADEKEKAGGRGSIHSNSVVKATACPTARQDLWGGCFWVASVAANVTADRVPPPLRCPLFCGCCRSCPTSFFFLTML